MSDWIYRSKPVTEEDLEGFLGFVYLIENTKSNRLYIGKKLLKHRKTVVKKGKRKKLLVSSDWAKYWGSNKVLLEEIEHIGVEHFTRTILRLCKTKGECSYWELREQIDRRALESDDYYNDYIYVRINRSHLPKDMLTR